MDPELPYVTHDHSDPDDSPQYHTLDDLWATIQQGLVERLNFDERIQAMMVTAARHAFYSGAVLTFNILCYGMSHPDDNRAADQLLTLCHEVKNYMKED